MRTLVLLAALTLTPTTAEAGAKHFGRAALTTVGALGGGLAGGFVGAPIYAAIDPYGTDDGLEWLLVGAPAGFGVGAAVGGTVAHGLLGGGRVGTELFFSGLVGVAGGALLVATPGVYREFEDHRFVMTYASGLGLALLGTPITAGLTSLFIGDALADKREARQTAFVPMVGRERAGLVLTGRF